ncbi:MAG: serpin family protein [Candidatus Woesearchaeota archaeon]
MNKKLLTFGIALLMIALVAATAVLFIFPYNPVHPPVVDDSGSTSQGIQEVVDANNRFAFELYSEIAKSEKGNLFYSPYSISAALAMTYEGAKGQTADEMKSVFHFPETAVLRPNFAAIYNDINDANGEYELKTGNALWVQQDYPFLKDYLNTVENYYGGKTANLDFIGETEKSRETINSFIEEQTNGKIKDLISSLDPMTRLVLTNAIYFKGTWEWEFDKSDTREQDFWITSANAVKVQMMFMDPEKAKFNYADLDNLQILELPYKGDKLSMLIILPKQGEDYDLGTGEKIVYDYSLEDIELSNEKLSEYKAQMSETKLSSISIPKFEFDTKYSSMGDTLKALGMPSAFNPGSADFSGMTGKQDLFISQVIHQAYVKVDEKGTEAAAATAVKMTATSAMQPNVFKADHPFIFIIQEKETGNILFIGRVVDPAQ